MYFLLDSFQPLGVFHLFWNAGCIEFLSSKKTVREKGLSPRRGPRRPLLPLSPKRTRFA
jgi:hypothetical protein